MSDFSAQNPAANIDELVAYLESRHDPSCIYRGQTAFHAPCVPSAFRPFVRDVDEEGWANLYPASIKRLAGLRYEEERLKVRSLLGSQFGKGLANILAQQYGLSSDMLDVTGSISMAAFFATRGAPTYDPFNPSSSDDCLGVIYRSRLNYTYVPEQIFNSAMEEVYAFSYQTGHKLFFTDVSMIYDLDIPETRSALIGHFPAGWSEIELLKMPFYCHPKLIETIFQQTQAWFPKQDGGNILEDPMAAGEAYYTSRLAGEVAGVVSPPLRYFGAISKNLRSDYRTGDALWLKADPPKAVTFGVGSVYDLNCNPNFERFFFRHDPTRAVSVGDLSLIWPPLEKDALFRYLHGVSSGIFARSGKPSPATLDEEFLDRGFVADDR